MSQPPRMIRVGDIVKPRPNTGTCGCCSGIVVDEMEMEDGFFMFEVLIGHESFWLDSIELKLVEEEDVRDAS